jgi:hypothetical protein
LIFERLKMSEFLKINNNDKIEVFVNIKSSPQNAEERSDLEARHGTKLNEFMTYAWPKLQFMNLDSEEYSKLFTEKIIIEKGWADEFKMTGIYVGWGVEPFMNEIEFELEDDKIQLKWTCVVDDMDRYDQAFKPFRSEIYAELEFKEFRTKDEFWEYEKYKLDNRI